MPNKHDVINTHALHPDWTARQIAEAIGGCEGYVNATARRNGISLAKYQPKGKPKRRRVDGIAPLGHAARGVGLSVDKILSLWACTGCGCFKSMEQIHAEHPNAIACCPKRKMAPVTLTLPRPDREAP